MVRIVLGDFKVEEVTNSSGIFTGENLQVQWKAFIKTNSGYGDISGDKNKYSRSKSVVVKTTSDDQD